MLLLSLILPLAFAIDDVYSKSVPFPWHGCKSHGSGDDLVRFCDSPDSIPHRYIVKFKECATDKEILKHLDVINKSFPGTDCSFGNWRPPPHKRDCKGASCTYPNLTSPHSVSVRSGDGFVISTCKKLYQQCKLQRTDRTKPKKCGFTYIYDTRTNFTKFRAYAAALPQCSLDLVLQDGIVTHLYISR